MERPHQSLTLFFFQNFYQKQRERLAGMEPQSCQLLTQGISLLVVMHMCEGPFFPPVILFHIVHGVSLFGTAASGSYWQCNDFRLSLGGNWCNGHLYIADYWLCKPETCSDDTKCKYCNLYV